MNRRLLTASTVLFGLVALVAFVRAQEDETQSVLKSINESSPAPTFASPPPSAVRGGPQFRIADGEEPTSSRSRQASRPSLADRLKQVRESVNRDSGARRTPTGTSSSPRPSASNPATSTPPIGDNSYRAPSPIGASAPTASNPATAGSAPSSRNSARRPSRAPIRAATEQPGTEQPTSEPPTSEFSTSELPASQLPAFGSEPTRSGSILPREQTAEPPSQFEEPAAPSVLGAPRTMGRPDVRPAPGALGGNVSC